MSDNDDWKEAINEGLKSLGLNPDEAVEVPAEKHSRYTIIDSYIADDSSIALRDTAVEYDPYDRLRGMTIQNPLMADDKNFLKQWDFCIQMTGHCFIKKYEKTNEPKNKND